MSSYSAMPAKPTQVTQKDLDHLKMLAIFHYVLAAGQALFSMIPLIHVAIGVAMISGAFDDGPDGPPPEFLGWIFIIGAGCFILFGLALAVMLVITGRKIAAHRSHTFCFVVAVIQIVFVPLGMILGIFTIVVLLRPQVKSQFERNTRF